MFLSYVEYLWINFELSISVEDAFYGVTIGYGSDNAIVMVGRKNFFSRIREAPTCAGLGLYVRGRIEDPPP